MRDPKRSPYSFFEARRLRWMKEGRGQGTGAEYQPWLQTRNVKSSGRKSRLRGIICDRVMHVMSDLERNAVIYFETQLNVTDIREQVPLDRDVTRKIAEAMGVTHPADPWTGEDIVMTTDLVVDFVNSLGKQVSRAFSVKEAKDLINSRTVVKLEIERRYWERYGIQCGLLLDSTLRRTKYLNAVLWARAWFYLPEDKRVSQAKWQRRIAIVVEILAAGKSGALGDVVQFAEASGEFATGDVLATLKHLIARKRVAYDYNLGTPTLATMSGSFIVIEPALRIAA